MNLQGLNVISAQNLIWKKLVKDYDAFIILKAVSNLINNLCS